MDATTTARLDAVAFYLRKEPSAMTNDEVIQGGPLTIDVRRTPDGKHVILGQGEVDLANAETFGQVVGDGLNSDAGQVVLDLRELSFIDSTGLRELLIQARVSNADSRRLGVIRPSSDEIGKLLALTGIDKTLRFLD